jgi:hypothetical protein
MSFRRTLILTLAGLVLAPLGSLAPVDARADEVVLGLENAIQADSNLFKTSTALVADANYELSPSILLRRREDEKLTYRLFYRPSYDWYFDNTEVNGIDHFFRAIADYAPSRVGRAWLRANLTDYRSVRAADAPTDGIPDVIGGAPGRVSRFFLDTGYDHQITRLNRVETRFELQSYQFDTPNNIDSLGIGGDVSLRRQAFPLVDVGIGLFSSWRQYREQLTQPGSDNVVVNPNLLLTFEPFETLVPDVSVGPAWIRTQQSGGGDATVARYRAATFQGQTVGAAYDVTCSGSSGRCR